MSKASASHTEHASHHRPPRDIGGGRQRFLRPHLFVFDLQLPTDHGLAAAGADRVAWSVEMSVDGELRCSSGRDGARHGCIG